MILYYYITSKIKQFTRFYVFTFLRSKHQVKTVLTMKTIG